MNKTNEKKKNTNEARVDENTVLSEEEKQQVDDDETKKSLQSIKKLKIKSDLEKLKVRKVFQSN